MEIKPIGNGEDHDRALREVERLWGAREGTPAGDRLEVPITLIEAYERANYPIDPPDPVDAIRFRLEQQGLGTGALAGVIGTRSRVYESPHSTHRQKEAQVGRLTSRLRHQDPPPR